MTKVEKDGHGSNYDDDRFIYLTKWIAHIQGKVKVNTLRFITIFKYSKDLKFKIAIHNLGMR